MYFLSDIRKIFCNRLVQICLIVFSVVMIAYPFSTLLRGEIYPGFFESFGKHPYQFWLLIDSTGWGFQVYFVMSWFTPVLLSGLILHDEMASSFGQFAMARVSKRKYLASKILSSFVFTFLCVLALQIANVVITFMIYSSDAPQTDQYAFCIPPEGSFAYPFYQISPFLMAIVYAAMNALAQALLVVLVVELHMTVHFKNRLIAVAVPTVLLYLNTMVFEASPVLHLFSLQWILQPLTSTAMCASNPVRLTHVLGAFGWIMFVNLVLAIAGSIRNRDVL